MTLLMNEYENELIQRIKSAEGLQEVRFVKAFNGRLREVPLSGVLVTVEKQSAVSSQFFGQGTGACKSELVLKIYSPYSLGGQGITEVLDAILSALPTADTQKLISGFALSEINYSKDYSAVCRSLVLALDYTVKEVAVNE